MPDPWAATDPRCVFPDATRQDTLTANVISVTDPRHSTFVDNIPQPQGWFFNQQEHFHSNVEDGSFGQALTRHKQPMTIPATGCRNIHFEADLKVSARRYVRIMLSPNVTKTITDERDPSNEFAPLKALDIWFLNGTFQVSVNPTHPDGAAASSSSPRYFGRDNIRDLIDVCINQTHVRIVINGITFLDRAIPPVGFDAGYLYLSQVSYNPCKDNECADNLQIFHWDNVAFDGPKLARNALTPLGYQDVTFTAYGQASCTVKGVPASPQGVVQGFTWLTWSARMLVQDVAPSDVRCTNAGGGQLWPGRRPMDLEIVTQ